MSIISWLQSNWGVVAALLVAIVDFLIGVNPSLKSNSIIEAILSFLSPSKPPGAS